MSVLLSPLVLLGLAVGFVIGLKGFKVFLPAAIMMLVAVLIPLLGWKMLSFAQMGQVYGALVGSFLLGYIATFTFVHCRTA